MQEKIELSVQESLNLAQERAYWDGYVAGIAQGAEHAKQLSIQKIVTARKESAPPSQPSVSE